VILQEDVWLNKENDIKISNTIKAKDILNNKKKLLLEVNEKYKVVDKTIVKIDLIDLQTNEKINIFSKGNLYASQYLTEKTSLWIKYR